MLITVLQVFMIGKQKAGTKLNLIFTDTIDAILFMHYSVK